MDIIQPAFYPILEVLILSEANFNGLQARTREAGAGAGEGTHQAVFTARMVRRWRWTQLFLFYVAIFF